MRGRRSEWWRLVLVHARALTLGWIDLRRTIALASASLLLACGGRDPDPTPIDPGNAVIGPSPVIVGDPPRNLLMISIDTLRRDHLTRFDPEGRNLTPFLDSLMEQGFVAESLRACSNWTFHSVPCTLGGQYPIDRGFVPGMLPNARAAWPSGSRFLADFLVDAGFYTTLASGTGWLGPAWGAADGYHTYQGEAFDPMALLYDLGTTDLEQALATRSEDRWFLHFHIVEPHAPFAPPEEYRQGEELLDPVPWDLDLYDAHYQATGAHRTLSTSEQANLEAHLRLRYEGEIRWMDDQLAEWWADLDARGWLDDTLVVFWNDHGEQFWERGQQSHGYTLNFEENDGFFLLWSRGLQPGANAGPTSQVDVVPTAMTLMDVAVPSEVTGLPLGTARANRVLFGASRGRLGMVQSIKFGDRQLNYNWKGKTRFYHLDTDPLQQDDRYDGKDPEVQQLWNLLLPRIHAAEPLVPEHIPEAPDQLKL